MLYSIPLSERVIQTFSCDNASCSSYHPVSCTIQFQTRNGSPQTTVQSTAAAVSGARVSYRQYNYTEIAMQLSDGIQEWVCINTASGLSYIDSKLVPKGTTYMRSPQPVKICGLNDKAHVSYEYVILTVFFPGTNNLNCPSVASVEHEFHVVNNLLKCKAMIGTDILLLDRFLLDFSSRTAKIQSCADILCPLRITDNSPGRWPVRTSTPVIVRAHKSILVPIKLERPLSPDQICCFTAQVTPDTENLYRRGSFNETAFSSRAIFNCQVHYVLKREQPVDTNSLGYLHWRVHHTIDVVSQSTINLIAQSVSAIDPFPCSYRDNIHTRQYSTSVRND
jgi:hypothetical protein